MAEGKAGSKPAPVAVRQERGGFTLSGVEGKDWEMSYFYVEDKGRALRLKSADGSVRIYTVVRPLG